MRWVVEGEEACFHENTLRFRERTRTASNLSNSIFSFEFKSQSDGDDIFPFNVMVWLRCGITTSLNRRRRQRTSIASHTHTQRWLRLRRLLLDRNLLELLVQLKGPCLEATTPQPWWRWHILTTIDFVGSIYSEPTLWHSHECDFPRGNNLAAQFLRQGSRWPMDTDSG